IADDVAQPTSPLPPSPIIPSSPPHQSSRPPPPQATEGSSLLVQQDLDKCSALVLRVKGLRRLKKVGTSQRIESLEDLENVFNQGRINVDIDEGIKLVVDQEKDAEIEGRQPMKKKDQIEMDAEYARKLQEEEESHVQAKGIQYIKRYHGYKKKPQSESEARK
nr:hypothetical protein [Tanacetum cinerariifolium]